jgi:uroporphyrinogen decarboxylase
LERYLGVEGVDTIESSLQVDRWRNVFLNYEIPREQVERLRGMVPPTVLAQEGVRMAPDGRVIRSHDLDTYGDDCLWFPLQDLQDLAELEAYPFPTSDQIRTPDPDLEQQVRQLKESDTVVQGHVTQPFKVAWQLRGMQNLFCDYLLAPRLVEMLYDRIYSFMTAEALAFAGAGVDMVCIIGDIGMQDRLMMGPEIWRRFDKPRLAEFIRTVNQAYRNLLLYMHSDGVLTDIVPDLVEVGLDILNPIQPECMDPLEIKTAWGDRLSLVGGVSMQRTLPFGSPDDVRGEVRRLVEHCGRGGGYVVGPANGITEDIPPENIVAMYEAVF